MKLIVKSLALLGLSVAAAGCEVKVDGNAAAQIENQVEAIGDDLGNAAADAGNTVSSAGDAIGNNVDVDVDLGGRDGETAEANAQ